MSGNLTEMHDCSVLFDTGVAEAGEQIGGLVWSPSGDQLAVYTRTGSVIIIGSDGLKRRDWKAHRGQVIEASWSSDGQLLATGGRDEHLRIWTALGEPVASVQHAEGWVEHVEWSPWSQTLLTGCSNNLRFWNQFGGLVAEFTSHQWPVTDIAWHPTRRETFASCAADGVRIWHICDSEPQYVLRTKEYPQMLAFNSRNSMIACGCADSSVRAWSFDSSTVLSVSGCSSVITGLEWSWGGQWLAYSSELEAYILQINNQAPRRSAPVRLSGACGRLNALRFHRYENLLAAADQEGLVCVWRMDRSKRSVPVATLHLNSKVVGLSWNPMSKQLAIADVLGKVTFWKSTFKDPTSNGRKGEL